MAPATGPSQPGCQRGATRLHPGAAEGVCACCSRLFTAVHAAAATHQVCSVAPRLGSLQFLGRRGNTSGRGASGLV